MRTVFISWAPHCSRSDNIAREIGATSHMVYKESLGSNFATVWLKYLWQTVETFRILRRERAEAAIAMTPPVFAGFALYLYSVFSPLRYAIDVHTAALLMPRWKHLQWLQRFVCRHAATTLVTNDHLASLIHVGGGHTTIVRDVPVQYPVGTRFASLERFTVAVVCSFNYDEPIDEILAAASRLTDVDFYFTGDFQRLSKAKIDGAPKNVRFTGFLSSEDYGSLLSHANAVMSLTTRDHTMLRGAYEAIYLGTPAIVSDWPLLHSAFDAGCAHVDNTAAGIAAGISKVKERPEWYRQQAHELRARKLSQWSQVKDAILARLRGSAH